MSTNRRGFALVELAMVGMVLTVIALLLAPFMKQRWNADGLSQSLNNMRTLMVANDEYRLDHAERVPMRGPGYQNGQITGGWDTWNFAGKNCNSFWQGQALDEHAYWRFLNPYIQSAPAPVPSGFVNFGSGATWTLQQGTLTAAQRAAYSVKTCRSPGDVATRQRSWPNPTPGISSYDDVGTSYHVNMKWWDTPGGPSQFTTRYNAGGEAIRAIPGSRWYRPSGNFVLFHDQVTDVVANSFGLTIPGEFGGDNMSVVGYLDGRSDYIAIVPGASSGPGYTLGITWP